MTNNFHISPVLYVLSWFNGIMIEIRNIIQLWWLKIPIYSNAFNVFNQISHHFSTMHRILESNKSSCFMSNNIYSITETFSFLLFIFFFWFCVSTHVVSSPVSFSMISKVFVCLRRKKKMLRLWCGFDESNVKFHRFFFLFMFDSS